MNVLKASKSNARIESSQGQNIMRRINANELFLAALALAHKSLTGDESLVVDFESHGRDSWDDVAAKFDGTHENPNSNASRLLNDVDLSHTVGWFTTMFPVTLNLAELRELGTRLHYAKTAAGTANDIILENAELLASLKMVTTALRSLPSRKSLFALQRVLGANDGVDEKPYFIGRRLLFNFLGSFGAVQRQHNSDGDVEQIEDIDVDSVPWQFSYDTKVDATWSSPRNRRSHDLIFDGIVLDGKLSFNFTFCPSFDTPQFAQALCDKFKTNLLALALTADAHYNLWTQRVIEISEAAELPRNTATSSNSSRRVCRLKGGSAPLDKLLNFLNSGYDSIQESDGSGEDMKLLASLLLLVALAPGPPVQLSCSHSTGPRQAQRHSY